MPPKKNRNAKKAGRFQEEPDVEEKVAKQEEEDVEYDSDGNEIVKQKEAPEASSSEAAPGKLSAREIVKLKKKKQKGLLTEEELAQYADVLGVEERYARSLSAAFRPSLNLYTLLLPVGACVSATRIQFSTGNSIGRPCEPRTHMFPIPNFVPFSLVH